MPPDRGRASQACTACRKQKTRRYTSASHRGPCLRCQRIQETCSLDVQTAANSRENVDAHESRTFDTDRLTRLERLVENVVTRLDALVSEPNTALSTRSTASDSILADREAGSERPTTLNAIAETPSSVTSIAPVLVLRDVAKEVGTTSQNASDRSNDLDFDLVHDHILTAEEVVSLLTIFVEHYGRWICLQESLDASSLAALRKSPVLLCACCLIAVRHTTQEYAATIAPQLFSYAKTLLSRSLLITPQTIEFYQASIILSLWSTTVGEELLSIDSWLITGFVLQHASSSDLFSHIGSVAITKTPSTHEITKWKLWNHLCLTHLHYCVGTRRKVSLHAAQIQKCAELPDLVSLNNFETRMVAEIALYWIIYESSATASVNLPLAQAKLAAWQNQWSFLFDQPRPQFIQIGHHFAQLILYDQALKLRSAAVRESLLLEMVRHSASILNLAMDTSDLRTPHLTDHIYHTISFAAVTLCRLLHMYEDQISTVHNISDLDQLILTLVTWLYSIGLPCHIAHKLGNLVSAFHAKLRFNAKPTPIYDDTWAQLDTLNLPDQFQNELFFFENGHFSPDWDPFSAPNQLF